MNWIVKIFKIIIVFSLPLFLLYRIYTSSSIQACFAPLVSTNEVEKAIFEKLSEHYKKIELYGPLVSFTKNWFVYDISIKNNLNSSAIIGNDGSYTQTLPIPIILVTKNGTTTVEVGKKGQLASLMLPENIPGLVSSFYISVSPSKEVTIYFEELSDNSSGFKLNLEFGPNSYICYIAELHRDYWWLVFTVLLFFWLGAITLLKEAFHFVNKSWAVYFGVRSEYIDKIDTKQSDKNQSWLNPLIQRTQKLGNRAYEKLKLLFRRKILIEKLKKLKGRYLGKNPQN